MRHVEGADRTLQPDVVDIADAGGVEEGDAVATAAGFDDLGPGVMRREREAAGELAISSLIDRAPLASSLADAYKSAGYRWALVGGSVRDAILGRLRKDLDSTINAAPQVSKKILSNWAENAWETGLAYGKVVGKRG